MQPLAEEPRIIKEVIDEKGLKAYLVGYDFNVYRWDEFIEEVSDVIVEFAFAFHKEEALTDRNIRRRMKKAAKAIYNIPEFAEVASIYLKGRCIDDKDQRLYLRKGEFGELLLHLFLTDYNQTVPLVSKIHFKDTDNAVVHGFDAVHIQEDTLTLWLGESKLFFNGQAGISQLLDDLTRHFNYDFMRSEFTLIQKKIPEGPVIPKRDHWINFLSEKNKLEDCIKNIRIPLLCTYTSPNFSTYNDENDPKFKLAFEKEIKDLQKYFLDHNAHKWNEKLQIILLLFPIKCKNAFVSRMHQKLYHMQRS